MKTTILIKENRIQIILEAEIKDDFDTIEKLATLPKDFRTWFSKKWIKKTSYGRVDEVIIFDNKRKRKR